MKNGLPSVSSVRRRTNCEVTSSGIIARASSAVRPVTSMRSNIASRLSRERSSPSAESPGRVVPRTSRRIGAASWSRWPSSSDVDVSAQCRSSRISTTGRSRAANASIRETPSNSR